MFGAASRTGTFERVASTRWRRDRVLILAYHGVSLDDEHEWAPALYLSETDLRDRFTRLLEGGYTVLPLDEAVERLKRHDLPPRAVVLTFDDGFYDFHARALPVLREFSLPATLYLTTYYCAYNRPVFDLMCLYLLWKARHRTLDLTTVIGDAEQVSLGDRTGRSAAYVRLMLSATDGGYTAVQKDELLARLAHSLGIDYDDLCERRVLHLMTPEEVHALPRDLVDVQLHTHRHRVPAERGAFMEEVERNRRAIDGMMGASPRDHFCFPTGFYRPEMLPWLRELGIRSATTCDSRLASADDDPLLLPRLVDGAAVTPLEFEAWVSGAASFIARRPSPLFGSTFSGGVANVIPYIHHSAPLLAHLELI